MFYKCIRVVCLRTLLINAALINSISSSQTGTVNNTANSQLKTQADCGVPAIASSIFSRIVGGTEAKPHSYPWQISLLKQSPSWRHFCGGSIIGRRLVVTAAHCVYTYDPNDIKCLIGSHAKDSTANTSTIDIDQIHCHPNYTGMTTGWQYDIAVLSLHEDITFNTFAQPICIPDTELTEGDICVATGWGRQGDGIASNVLNEVTVPIVPRNTCHKIYPSVIVPTMMCAGWTEGKRDTCQGDSGGPLVKPSAGKWFLYGITSVGSSCAEPNKPGIYTNIVLLRSWIRSFTIIASAQPLRPTSAQPLRPTSAQPLRPTSAQPLRPTSAQPLRPPVESVCSWTSSFVVDRPSQQKTNEAFPHSHPSLASISYRRDNWLHRCSGCVVGARWILTSAACLHDRNKKPLMAAEVRVLVGAHRLDTHERTEQELPAKYSFIHPEFSFSTLENNIALLYLSGDIYFSGHIKPVCLPRNSSNYQRNCVSCRTVGWNGICDRQPVVREKFTDVLNDGKSYLRKGNQPDFLAARYSSRKDYYCSEDRGWLLLCLCNKQVNLIGLKSFDIFTRPEYTGIYTAVVEHVDWIEQTRASHKPSTT